MKRMQAIVKLLLCLVVISVHGFSSYSRRRWGGNGGKSQFRMSYLSTLESGIAVAGVVAIHEAGHFLAARSFDMKIDSYNVGYGPKLLAFNETYKGGDIEYALRAFPLGGYVAFPSNVQYDDEKGNELTEPMELDDPDLLQNRPAFQRAVVISAGVIANIFLTWSLASYTACTTGLTHPTFAPGVQVTAAPAVDSPALVAGLRYKDIVTKIDSKIIDGEGSVQDFIKIVRENPNKNLQLEVIRDAKAISTAVTPEISKTNGRGSIGLPIARRIDKVTIDKGENIFQALQIGADETSRLISSTWAAFQIALSSGFAGSEVGGPISLIKSGSDIAEKGGANGGAGSLIGFAAAVSVNLAVLNALPFPVLDGGQLVFVIAESLIGKPIPRKAKETIIALATSILLGLGVTTFAGDISKILK